MAVRLTATAQVKSWFFMYRVAWPVGYIIIYYRVVSYLDMLFRSCQKLDNIKGRVSSYSSLEFLEIQLHPFVGGGRAGFNVYLMNLSMLVIGYES